MPKYRYELWADGFIDEENGQRYPAIVASRQYDGALSSQDVLSEMLMNDFYGAEEVLNFLEGNCTYWFLREVIIAAESDLERGDVADLVKRFDQGEFV